MKYRIRTSGMGCPHCIARVTKAMEAIGADIVSMELNDFTITFPGDTTAVRKAITDLGFEVISIEAA